MLCRIFKKSTAGEKATDTSVLTRIRNCGDDSETSDLPPLMDFSSDENHQTRNSGVSEGSHVTCFSHPTEEPQDITFDDFSSSSSSLRNPYLSPYQFVLPNFPTRFSDNLINSESGLMKQNAKVEFSQDREVGYMPYEDQEFSMISTGPVDLDCLWNY